MRGEGRIINWEWLNTKLQIWKLKLRKSPRIRAKRQGNPSGDLKPENMTRGYPGRVWPQRKRKTSTFHWRPFWTTGTSFFTISATKRNDELNLHVVLVAAREALNRYIESNLAQVLLDFCWTTKDRSKILFNSYFCHLGSAFPYLWHELPSVPPLSFVSENSSFLCPN